MAGASAAALLLGAIAAGCGGQEPRLGEDRLGMLIDSLLPRIAESSGLEVRRPVRRHRRSRRSQTRSPAYARTSRTPGSHR